nr:hypothetical protein [uncultured Actinoplanes sp.]
MLLEDAAEIVELAGHSTAGELLHAEVARIRQVLAVVPTRPGNDRWPPTGLSAVVQREVIA